MELRLDHVAIAVKAIDPAVRLFGHALGGEIVRSGEEPKGWRWLQLAYPGGGGKVELLEPTGDNFLSRFLEARGEGLHHITFQTDDIRLAIARIQEQGYELVDVEIDDPHWKQAFLRPSRAHGTLVQLVEY